MHFIFEENDFLFDISGDNNFLFVILQLLFKSIFELSVIIFYFYNII